MTVYGQVYKTSLSKTYISEQTYVSEVNSKYTINIETVRISVSHHKQRTIIS